MPTDIVTLNEVKTYLRVDHDDEDVREIGRAIGIELHTIADASMVDPG